MEPVNRHPRRSDVLRGELSRSELSLRVPGITGQDGSEWCDTAHCGARGFKAAEVLMIRR